MIKMPIVDLHMHVVPNYDDGSQSIAESIAMLRLSSDQGVTDVFCTSHNGYCEEDAERYQKSFSNLQKAIKEAKIPIRIHQGCEILCAGEYIEDIVYGLEKKVFQTLGNTRYVLTELYSDAKPSEALYIVKSLREQGYIPIIAHMERNYNITGRMVGILIASGAKIQVNAISFCDEYDDNIKGRARKMLDNGYVHFLGSDSHRIDHRPPNLASGAQYIMNTCEADVTKKILYDNAKTLLFGE